MLGNYYDAPRLEAQALFLFKQKQIYFYVYECLFCVNVCLLPVCSA